MSKRLGNVTDPMEVIPETGADALRWYFCINNPEVNSRFSARLVREGAQNFLLPLWNALSFFTIYANLDEWSPGAESVPFERRPALDRWILLRLDRLVEDTTRSLEGYRVLDAARLIEEFVDDLTNWYIRRSRDRFWAPAAEGGETKESAYQTLYEVLCVLARVIAPFTPFVADVLHRHLLRTQAGYSVESVHLEEWPRAAAQRADEKLESGMAAVQRIVRLGHAARNSHSLKTRQPLASVTLVTTDDELPDLVEPHLDVLREELNVRRGAVGQRPIGLCAPRGAPRLSSLRPPIRQADGGPQEGTGSRRRRQPGRRAGGHGSASPRARRRDRRALAQRRSRSGWWSRRRPHRRAIASCLVVLDTHLSEDLIAEGWAREVIHRIQTARKEANLDYADRIRVTYLTDPKLAAAIDQFREWICRETLALELAAASDDSADLMAKPVEEMDFRFAIQTTTS